MKLVLTLLVLFPLQSFSNISPSIPLPEIPNDKSAPNSVRAWYYWPHLRPHLKELGQTVFNKGRFSWKLKFMIMSVVASRNKCKYCLCSAVRGLVSNQVDKKSILALQQNLSKLKVSKKEKVALQLAEAVTVNPSGSSKYVIEGKKLGWKNEQLADIIYFASYFNLSTRVVTGFNVPPDKTHPFDPKKPLPMTSCN